MQKGVKPLFALWRKEVREFLKCLRMAAQFSKQFKQDIPVDSVLCDGCETLQACPAYEAKGKANLEKMRSA